MVSAAIVAAASLVCNAQINSSIVNKLEADDGVTSVYLSRGMLKSVRFALNTQLDGAIDMMSMPVPYDVQSMQVFECKNSNSAALAKELVEQWRKEHKDVEQLGRVKNGGVITNVYGILKDETEEGELRYSAVMFYQSNSNGDKAKVVYCDGK